MPNKNAPGVPHETSSLILETSQTNETFLRAAFGEATVRLLFQRAEEARAQDLTGQDYARVESAADGSLICFCVADGVGSSYQGEFAAAYLATHLVDWLFRTTSPHWRDDALLAPLGDALRGWASSGQAHLLDQPLPTKTPSLVAEVLDELRANYGSETVFMAGRVERLHDTQAGENVMRTHIGLWWMGNVTARILTGNGRAIDSAPDQDHTDRDRWSTARGLQGTLHCQSYSCDDIARLIISTDGAAPLERMIAALGDDDLLGRSRALLQSPTSDDVTILDLQWPS